jgi:hypothetical protein
MPLLVVCSLIPWYIALTMVSQSVEAQLSAIKKQNQEVSSASAKTTGKLAIFYNIFTAPGNSTLTLGIVKEQLTTWRASNVTNATLYYNLLGEKIHIPCKSNEKCSLLEHTENGDEIGTLQELHEYCKNNPQDAVIYIHNKGSFHPNEENTLMRRVLTKAVFLDACTGLKRDDNSCNVCSARFSPIPHWHSPGNMWVAQCDYIRNLIAPKLFPTHVDKAVEEAKRRWEWKVSHPSSLGQGRFASEHWVHTHPNVNPCELYSSDHWVWGYTCTLRLDVNGKFERARAPRFPISTYYRPYKQFKQLPMWISLLYRLFELRMLYNETPTADSWVWDFYDLNVSESARSAESTESCGESADSKKAEAVLSLVR